MVFEHFRLSEGAILGLILGPIFGLKWAPSAPICGTQGKISLWIDLGKAWAQGPGLAQARPEMEGVFLLHFADPQDLGPKRKGFFAMGGFFLLSNWWYGDKKSQSIGSKTLP